MFPIRLNDDVALELLEVRHADELFRVTDANRAHLREWLPWVDGTTSLEDTKAFIQVVRKQLFDNKGFQTAIRFRGALVGVGCRCGRRGDGRLVGSREAPRPGVLARPG